MNWIKRFVGVFFIILLLFTLLSTILGWLYKDDVKQIVLQELNSQFLAPISFEEIDISLFQHFPKATASFTKVSVINPIHKKDTIAFLQQLDLAFNPFSFFTNQYNISLVAIQDGFLHLNETVTWKDLYQGNSKEDESTLHVIIEKILLNNIHFQYNNKKKAFALATDVNDVVLSGNFSASQFDLISTGDVFLHYLKSNEVHYIQDKAIRLNTSISVNTEQNIWKFNPSNIFYGNLPLALSGKFTDKPEGLVCDILATGNNWEIQQVMNDLVWLPSYKDEWKWYGHANATATLTGLWNSTSNPIINLAVAWKDGTWEWNKHQWKLEHINLNGEYTNATPSGVDKIKINEFTATQNQSSIDIQGAIARLEDPFFNLWGTNKIDLKLLSPWVDTLGVSNLDGLATLTFKTKGKASNKKLHWFDFFSIDSEASLTLKNTKFTWNKVNVEALNGEVFQIIKNSSIRNLTGKVNGTSFDIKGLVKNWVGWQPNTQDVLILELATKVDNLTLEDWIKSDGSSEKIELPKNISSSIKFSASSMQWKNFNASNLYGLVQYSNQVFSTTGFKFNHAEGVIITNTSLQQNPNNWHLSSNTTLKQINVNSFFKQWDNFGQQTIKHEQINGIANAQALVNCDINQSGVDINSLYSLIDFSIKNGSLVNNSALADIGGYLKSNLMIKAFVKTDYLAKNLNNLQFSELTNLIEINNGTVVIPEMKITTNALSLKANGSHSFNQDINYHFNFLLNDVLRSGKPKNTEEGMSEDGKRIFLKASGSVNKPTFSLDRTAAKAFKHAQEESQIKKVNDDRFSDTLNTEKTPTFQFDWEKSKTNEKSTTQKPDTSKNRFEKWLNKLEKEDKKEKELDWEIEFPDQE